MAFRVMTAYIEEDGPVRRFSRSPILRRIFANPVHEACARMRGDASSGARRASPTAARSCAAWPPSSSMHPSACGMASRWGPGHGRRGMGQFGRLTKVSDLPGKRELRGYIRQAMKLIDEGVTRTSTRSAGAKAPLAVPDDLAVALGKNANACAAFEGFPPSARREYIEWITEAKREDTRMKRLSRRSNGWPMASGATGSTRTAERRGEIPCRRLSRSVRPARA